MNTTTRGVFVGLATADVVYRVDTFPKDNAKIVAQSQQIFAGGPATNAAIAFANLGGVALLAAAVGRHPITSVIRDELQRCGVQLVDLHPDFAEAPAVSCIAVNLRGERCVISANAHRIGAAITHPDERALRGASVLLVDGHQMQACQNWARAGHELGVPVVFDGGSWKEGTEDLLKYVDVAICSSDFKTPRCTADHEVLNDLRARGVSRAAISHGAEPIQFVSQESCGTIPVPSIDAIDTMGAGDILHGAFCYFTMLGQSFPDALREAAAVASESCRYQGTREWIEKRQYQE